MSVRLDKIALVVLALVGAAQAWPDSPWSRALLPHAAMAQDAFVLRPTERGLRLELDDIGADDALRQLAGEYGFEVMWRVQTPALRVTGWREGNPAQIATWILRGYDYAMTTRGSGIDRRPVRIVVFGERNATATSPAPSVPDPSVPQSLDPNLPNYDPNAAPPGYDPNVAPGDIADPPPTTAPYDPPPEDAPQDLAPEQLPP